MTETPHPHVLRKHKKAREEESRKKFHLRPRAKVAEGKGVVKEHNDSGYANHRVAKNKIKVRDEISEDLSE